MGTRVIAFSNFKGGVGKTANVVNIGAVLAKYHDRKVLIIDLLKTLAKANAIPFSRETSKNRLMELITHYARRAHANFRHRA